MTLAQAIDILVSVLLVVTIFYAVTLNRKLGQLRTSRAEFEKLVAEFSLAAARTEGSIVALKQSAGEQQAGLQQKIDRAGGLRDELAFILDRGDGLADQLDGLIRAGRRAGQSASADAGTAPATPVRGLRGFG